MVLRGVLVFFVACLFLMAVPLSAQSLAWAQPAGSGGEVALTLGGCITGIFAFPGLSGDPLVFAVVEEKDGTSSLYRSKDTGRTWERVAWIVDNVQMDDLVLRSLAMLSDGTLVLSAASRVTGQEQPLLAFSVDGGARWETQKENRLVPLVTWAAGSRLFGLFEYGKTSVIKASDDRGKTWLTDLTTVGDWNSRCFTACDAQTYFAISDDGILRATDDGGATWRNTGIRLSSAPLPLGPLRRPSVALPAMLGGEVAAAREADGSLTVVACSPASYAGVFVSRDGGKSWKSVDPAQFEWRPRHAASSVFSVAVAPGGLIFAGTPDECILISEDYGVTWKPITQGIHSEVLELACLPSGDSVVVLAATPTGLLRMEYQRRQVQAGGAPGQGAGDSEGQNQGQASGEASPPVAVKFVIGQRAFWVGDRKKDMDAEAFTESGRTYVPVRYLGEALGAEVGWDGATQTVTMTKDGVSVRLVVGDKTIYVNGQAKDMDVAPLIRGGRTYLPARYVAEAFGYKVNWNPATQAVSVAQ